jgi:hypothetical protein
MINQLRPFSITITPPRRRETSRLTRGNHFGPGLAGQDPNLGWRGGSGIGPVRVSLETQRRHG